LKSGRQRSCGQACPAGFLDIGLVSATFEAARKDRFFFPGPTFWGEPSGMSTSEASEQKDISVTLPDRHWVVILALLQDYIDGTSMPRLEELKEKGIDPETLSREEITALTGPLLARGLIVKELVNHGVMKPEVADHLDELMELAKKQTK
jgi:hypothetical protein